MMRQETLDSHNHREAVARNEPVSFVTHTGDSYPLSRYNDQVWDLSSYIPNPNLGRAGKCIDWQYLPAEWIDSAKAIALAYWRHGIPGAKPPKARSVWGFVWGLKPFLEWLIRHGIDHFSDVHPIHIREFVTHSNSLDLAANSLVCRFAAIEKTYLLRGHVHDALTCHPWPTSSARNQAGITEQGPPQSSTAVIPLVLATDLCRAAEALLAQSDDYISAKNVCDRIEHARQYQSAATVLKAKNTYLKSAGLPSSQEFRKNLLDMVTAAYLLLGLLTGMRNHELASLEVGAYYETEHDGETFGWLRGTSLKTDEGLTEWMVPREVGGRVIEFLERHSAPVRKQVAAELATINAQMALAGDDELAHLARERSRLHSERRRLFLTPDMTAGNQINSASNSTWNFRLKLFAQRHGIDWQPKTHQLRRTFAALVVRTGLGDLRYLRDHFKHRSLDMTLLYAMNPRQDDKLLGEIMATAEQHRQAMIERWLDEDTLLAGGGGEGIRRQRAEFAGLTASQRNDLITQSARNTFIRGTGHAWCLAEKMGCGGHGLYDALRCGGCSNGVIDESVADVWRGIGRQQLELRGLTDIGPGGQQKVDANIDIARDVLSRLGIELDQLSPFPQETNPADG